MDPNEITLTYTISQEDYLAAVRLNRKRPSRFAGIILLALSMILIGFDFFLKDPDTDSFVILLPFVVFVAVIFFLRSIWLPAKVRKIYAQQKTLHDEINVVLTEEAFALSTARAQSNLTWDIFRKWRANDKMILLFQSDILFIMIPLRAFKHPEDLMWFRDLLERRVSKK